MSLQKSLTLSLAAGRSVYQGSLAKTKDDLRAEVAMLTALYSRDGGVIHVCRPAFAAGCETPPAVRAAIRRGMRCPSPLSGF